MGIRAEGGLADRSEEIEKRLPGLDEGAQDERVHEHADNLLGLRLSPVRDRGSNPDVALTAPAGKQDREGGEQDHEGRRSSLPGESADFRRERGLEGERDNPAGVAPGLRVGAGRLGA
jgi:hypothetical protein